MSTITREQLHERAREKVKSLEFAVTQTAFADSRAELEEELELARIALASLEAEAVCVIDQSNLDYLKSGSDADVWPASRTEMGDVLLYRAAPPAPVSDEDLLHMAASAIDDLLSNKDRSGAGVWADIPAKLRRAAMLQGAENAESRCTIQTAPVLDSLLKKAESRCSNSPMALDGWVACSERMPEEGSKVIVFRPRAEESNDPPVKTAIYKGGREYYHGFDCYCEPTHWMPLPAAPQLEVK